MYNPNSPIINGMMGMQQSIPSMPIGNIGYNNNGYNGGFYNGVYNNYFNPYAQMQMQKQKEQEYINSVNAQSKVLMMMSNTAHAANNSTITQQQLDKMYKPISPEQQQKSAEDIHYEEMRRRSNLVPYDPSMDPRLTNEIIKFQKENEKYVSTDMSFEDFCKNAGNLLYEIRVQESTAQQRDLSGLYNKNDYSKLINGGYNNNLFKPEVTLDDMSVFPSLGSKLKDEYAARKQAFMNAILSQN